MCHHVNNFWHEPDDVLLDAVGDKAELHVLGASFEVSIFCKEDGAVLVLVHTHWRV